MQGRSRFRIRGQRVLCLRNIIGVRVKMMMMRAVSIRIVPGAIIRMMRKRIGIRRGGRGQEVGVDLLVLNLLC